MQTMEFEVIAHGKSKIETAGICWIARATKSDVTQVFWTYTDSESLKPQNKAEVIETPDQIALKLNDLELFTVKIGDTHFTALGAAVALEHPSFLEKNGLGVLNATQQGELRQFLVDSKAANKKVREETVTLFLGGDPTMVQQFATAAKEVALAFGTVNQARHTYGEFVPGTSCESITVHCPHTPHYTSLERQQQYVDAVRMQLPAQGRAIGVHFGGGK